MTAHLRTVYIDYGGTLSALSNAEAWHLYARLRVAGWRAQCWSAAPEGVPAEWAAITKDLHALEPGDVVVDDDAQLRRAVQRQHGVMADGTKWPGLERAVRAFGPEDLLRLPELLKEETMEDKPITEVGRAVECVVCHRNKKPRGRDAAAAAANGYCDDDCPGYRQPPDPGHLWPGETQEEYGY